VSLNLICVEHPARLCRCGNWHGSADNCGEIQCIWVVLNWDYRYTQSDPKWIRNLVRPHSNLSVFVQF